MPVSKIINDKIVVLNDSERQLTEVWDRVMGYFRPTSFWNPGKLSEFADRKRYSESNFGWIFTDKPEKISV